MERGSPSSTSKMGHAIPIKKKGRISKSVCKNFK
jgi:hypothetical protein